MGNFKVNVDRAEPDLQKIRVKKGNFEQFHAQNFPKSSFFHSKWFWGVSGIATVALVVSISLTFFKNDKTKDLAHQNNNKLEIASPPSQGDVSVVDKKQLALAIEENRNASNSVNESEIVVKNDMPQKKEIENKGTNEDESKIPEVETRTPNVEKSELFSLDFDPLDFPNLEVGNNLFYFDQSNAVSKNEVFQQEWDDISLENKNGQLNLKLGRNGEVHNFVVQQYKK